jgi:hypothetical protein
MIDFYDRSFQKILPKVQSLHTGRCVALFGVGLDDCDILSVFYIEVLL